MYVLAELLINSYNNSKFSKTAIEEYYCEMIDLK